MSKIEDNTIYKLYRNTMVKPTYDLYIKPLAGLASSSIALALVNNMDLDNNLALCASVGMATFFGLSTIKKIKFYNRVKDIYDSSCVEIKSFLEEAQNVVGTEYNLNRDNVAFMPCMGIGLGEDSFFMGDVIFRDSSKITE